MPSHADSLNALVAVGVSFAAAIIDHRTGCIPNRLVAIGAAIAVGTRLWLAAFLNGPSAIFSALIVSVLGALACGLIPLALYLGRGMGGGDVKLLAVCGISLGPTIGLEAELYAFGLGALYAFGRAAYGGVLWQTLRGSTLLLTNPIVPRRFQKQVAPSVLTPIRFGPAICCGVVASIALHWSRA